jgi:hypothetical protein
MKRQHNSTQAECPGTIAATVDYYQAIHQSRQAHDLHRLIGRYLDELEATGIENPLAEPFTLAAVLNDLCALAGITPPVVVRMAIGD